MQCLPYAEFLAANTVKFTKSVFCLQLQFSLLAAQDDMFPEGWALGQGTDPYGLPFLTGLQDILAL